MRKFDWLNVLDVEESIDNVRTDIYGDWYKDPWDWPELCWVAAHAMPLIEERLEDSGAKSSLAIDVPKENFGVRPAQVLDLLDRVCYQAVVDKLSRRLIGNMRPWVYSWRLNRTTPVPGKYNAQKREWQLYRQSLATLSDFYYAALTTDITSFFASIAIDRMIEKVYQSASKSNLSNRLVDMLRGWASKTGRSGLPQRASASNVLANAFLQPLDDLLARRGVTNAVWAVPTTEGSAIRWLDDVWLFGQDPGDLRQSQIYIDQVIRSLGLVTNLAKTSVYEGDELAHQARRLEHSAVDQGLTAQPVDPSALDQLIERIVAAPETASRTSIRFATSRIRDHDLYSRTEPFKEVAHRMPQGAEHLARLFRDGDEYRNLDDWYIEYLNSPWSCIDLASANLAKMFPRAVSPSASLAAAVPEIAHTTKSLPLLAWSIERLTAWSPDEARYVARQRGPESARPEERRVLALAALAANEERQFLRDLLSEFKENDVTLLMLEDSRFTAIAASADFAGN